MNELKEQIENYLNEHNIYYIFENVPSEHFNCIINSHFVIFNIGDDFYYAKKQLCKNNGGFYFLINDFDTFEFNLKSVMSYDEETWRDIDWLDLPYKYQISDKGRIYNKTRKVFLKTYEKSNGYVQVQLSKKHYCLVHRLVATAFISNEDDKPYVNHKDGNKSNNNVDNLEWVTPSENAEHYQKQLRPTKSAEKTVENRIKDYLFGKGYLYFKVHGSKFMVPGISDIIACICGRFVAIEVKAPGLKHTESEQQKIFGSNVIKSNGHYFLVDSLEEVIEIVEGIERVESKTTDKNN